MHSFAHFLLLILFFSFFFKFYAILAALDGYGMNPGYDVIF